MSRLSLPGLGGVRVVDFGHQIAGPLAALLLAEAGADVVHVDSPQAAGALGPTDAYLNRSKRRITLDLKSGADRATARDLVARADVVIENFRPGVMGRLGFGAEALRAADERLIYCALPGFAADDARACVPAWEGVLHAAVAGYRPLTQHWDPTGRRRITVPDPQAPLFSPITTASNFGGLMGAVCVVMALIDRRRTGRGQAIELPLAEAYTEAYSTMLGMRVYENGLMGDGQMLRDLTYECADGRLIDLSPYAKFVIPLLVSAGVAHEWQAEGLIQIAARSFSRDRRDQIMAKFAELVRSHPAAWWEQVAIAARMPAVMVRTPQEWMASDHARASGAVITLDDPIAGPIAMPGRGFELSRPPPAPSPRHRPDQDRAELLRELEAEPAPGPAPAGAPLDRVSQLPLAGIRVVELSQAVAGPTAARLLADFGAEVIKIGSTVPAVTDGIVGQLHRGKRTILVDSRSEGGAALTRDLIRRCDVLVTNFIPASQARYGIGDDQVRALNPQLVHCSITAYGQRGPWADRRGYENQCNAATGMSWRYGSRFGWTLYQPTPINDASTGILGAFAVAVALYARANGGGGQKVAACLAQGSTLHQAPYLVAEAQGPAGDLDASRSEYGCSALYRLYRTADRWIFLAARPRDVTALANALALETTMDELSTWRDPAGALAGNLAARFAAGRAGDQLARLAGHGIAAQAIASIDEAVEYLGRRGVVYVEAGVDGRDTARPGVGRWLSRTPPRAGANPGAVGSQAVEIMAELGLTPAQMGELADASVVCLPDSLPQLTRLT